MKICVCGSRCYDDEFFVVDAVGASGFDLTELVCGMARGVDMAAYRVYDGKVPIRAFPADWDRHGRRAGYVRNAVMVGECDAVIAIWDGKSRGTKHTIDLCAKVGKPLFVYHPERMHPDMLWENS